MLRRLLVALPCDRAGSCQVMERRLTQAGIIAPLEVRALAAEVLSADQWPCAQREDEEPEEDDAPKSKIRTANLGRTAKESDE